MGLRRTPDQVKETDRIVRRKLPKGKHTKDTLAKINAALAKRKLPILKSQEALVNLRKGLLRRVEAASPAFPLRALLRRFGGASRAIASYYRGMLVSHMGTWDP